MTARSPSSADKIARDTAQYTIGEIADVVRPADDDWQSDLVVPPVSQPVGFGDVWLHRSSSRTIGSRVSPDTRCFPDSARSPSMSVRREGFGRCWPREPMSRTAHHFSRSFPETDYGSLPRRERILVDLRYDDRCLEEAARHGRRPRPRRIRHAARIYSIARVDPRSRSVSQEASWEEHQARQRLRLSAEMIRKAANATAGGSSVPEAVEGLEVPPASHRRNAVWCA